MRNITFQSIPKQLVLIFISFILATSCAKKEVNDPGEVLLSFFLYQNLTNPVCSSFTPESAATLSTDSNGFFKYIAPNVASTISASVPAGKQCYFKFVAPSSDTYLISHSNNYNVVYNVGLINKTQTKLPTTSSTFDNENLFTNLGGSSTSFNDTLFYQKANSYRVIVADGTSCTSRCLITFAISKNNSFDGCSSSRGSLQIPSSAVIRFDESGVSIPTVTRSSVNDCYFLFVSPGETVSHLTQTKTYTGGTSVSMVLSVSSPVTTTASTFTSSASNTNASAATLSGLSTSLGQGRYILGAYSNSSSSDYSFTLSNSY